MSESFNRRFALEQAVLLHKRNPERVLEGTKGSVIDAADRFLTFLEADK